MKQDDDASCTITKKGSDKPVKVNGGSLIGISASANVKNALDKLDKGTAVQIVSAGQKNHPTTPGYKIWDLEVRVEDTIPF